MQVSRVNNFNFYGRKVKISKPTKDMLIGTGIMTAGTGSIFLGLDASGIAPIGILEKIQNGLNNNVLASTSSAILSSSCPFGTVLAPAGSGIIKEALNDDINEDNIPS